MIIELIPKESFDKASAETIKKVAGIAEESLLKFGIPTAQGIEFYDDLGLFIKRVSPQVRSYGLGEKQAVEFIKCSLNTSTYGTFDMPKKTIIEMNFNPYFKFFYPSIQFLELIIHESLHLFLYSSLKKDIYTRKFQFRNEEYVGEEKIIQLDEGFAEYLTRIIMQKYNCNEIKELPIYSSLNSAPQFEEIVENLNIKKLNENFEKIYEKNKKKGIKIIKEKTIYSVGKNLLLMHNRLGLCHNALHEENITLNGEIVDLEYVSLSTEEGIYRDVWYCLLSFAEIFGTPLNISRFVEGYSTKKAKLVITGNKMEEMEESSKTAANQILNIQR